MDIKGNLKKVCHPSGFLSHDLDDQIDVLSNKIKFFESPFNLTLNISGKMISRKKILSCSQNDLSCDSGYEQGEEDVWYQKKTLYKVSIFQFNKAHINSG